MGDEIKEKSRGNWKKVCSWIVTVVCIVLCVFAVVLLVLNVAAGKSERRSVEIFGYSFSLVETDSMTGEIEAGELITVKICDIREAAVGLNAVYVAAEGLLAGRQIVHKVIDSGTDERGFYLITQGVKEGSPVDKPVYESENRFVGIAVRHSAFFGKVAKFFASPENWILLLALIVGIPSVYASVKLVVKFGREVKKEKSTVSLRQEDPKEKISEDTKRSENDNDRKE